MGRIRFKINYQVKQKRKFEQFLELYQSKIGLRFNELKIEKYWKVHEELQANFFVDTDSTSNESRVYEILIMADQLWSTGHSNWTISGPHENGNLIFECILNNDNDDQPLKWAHIEIENE